MENLKFEGDLTPEMTKKVLEFLVPAVHILEDRIKELERRLSVSEARLMTETINSKSLSSRRLQSLLGISGSTFKRYRSDGLIKRYGEGLWGITEAGFEDKRIKLRLSSYDFSGLSDGFKNVSVDYLPSSSVPLVNMSDIL